MYGIDSRISLTERMVKSVTIGLTCLLDSVPRRNDNIVQYYDQASGCCAFHPNEEKKIQLARDKHSLRMTHNGNEYENDQFVRLISFIYFVLHFVQSDYSSSYFIKSNYDNSLFSFLWVQFHWQLKAIPMSIQRNNTLNKF